MEMQTEPCEIRLERLRKKTNIVDNEKPFYQSYTWGSVGDLEIAAIRTLFLSFFTMCLDDKFSLMAILVRE